jgi:WD40 repeat protein
MRGATSSRWECALPIAVALAVLGAAGACLQAAVAPAAAGEQPTGPAASLPPRALVRLGTADLRTEGNLAALAFSPDGRLIAAADPNARGPQVALFDVHTGRLATRLCAPGHRWEGVVTVAFSPDGTKLLWGENTGAVALWSLPGDRLLFRKQLHDRDVYGVAFSPDGSLMASASGAVIHLRRTAKPAEGVRDLTTHPGPAPGQIHAAIAAASAIPADQGIRCLAFTPDGSRIVAGTFHESTLFIWQIQDGRLLTMIPAAHGTGAEPTANLSVNCVAVTPDGRRIMSVGHSTRLIEGAKPRNDPRNVSVSEVRFWDIENGRLVADYHRDEDEGVGFGALSRDGRHVAVADFGRLRILDAATGQAERTIELPGVLGDQPTFSADGRLVAMPIRNTVGLFEVSTGHRLHHHPNTPVGILVSAAWSPSGDRIVTGHADGFVRVWNASSGKLIWHKLLAPVISRSGWDANPAFVGFSRDGKLVVAAGVRHDPVIPYGRGVVAFYDAGSGGTVRELLQKRIRWAGLAPDGQMVAVAATEGSGHDVHFVGIEVATGQTRWANPPEDQEAGFSALAGMQFEAKPPWFQAALRDGSVIRFNGLTGHEQRRFVAEWRTPELQQAVPRPLPEMDQATFSVDGRTLVSSHTEWIYVWDVSSGTMRRKIRHPHQHACRLALAADGRTLATSDPRYHDDPGEDVIRLYDIETGQRILTLQPGDGRAGVLVFSPDGKRLFTGFERGSGIVSDVGR